MVDDPRERSSIEALKRVIERRECAGRRHRLPLRIVPVGAATVGQCDALVLVPHHAFARRGLTGPHVRRA